MSDHLEEVAIPINIWEVEDILAYQFRNPKLLVESLTHSSYTGSSSYQRLEFLGDALLGNLFANFVFLQYPDLDPGRLSLIRAANISTENLARVAVRTGLYRYLRHSATALDMQIQEFVTAIHQEEELEQFGGTVKAPKVLADIVESVAAAIYVDLEYNLHKLWDVFEHMLEPIVTKDCLHDQPVTVLYELCQKLGKQVRFEQYRKDSKNYAIVYVDGDALGRGESGQKHTAKLTAARVALEKLQNNLSTSETVEGTTSINEYVAINGAKQKLLEFCSKGHWLKPVYCINEEKGPSHDKTYICSCEVKIGVKLYVTLGGARTKLKEAQSSAASVMLYHLKEELNLA